MSILNFQLLIHVISHLHASQWYGSSCIPSVYEFNLIQKSRIFKHSSIIDVHSLKGNGSIFVPSSRLFSAQIFLYCFQILRSGKAISK